MSKAFIRKATSQDLNSILKLLESILALHHSGRPDIFRNAGSKYTYEELENIISDEKTPVFVADDANGNILGYAFCIEKEIGNNALQDRKILYLDDLCVDETKRGSGTGKLLMEHIKKYAKEINADNLELNVWSFNKQAISFYEHMGFTVQKSTMEIKI